jgi:ABC-type bacteriocin/lantibiotic exporter with double-glycine peptidase domain
MTVLIAFAAIGKASRSLAESLLVLGEARGAVSSIRDLLETEPEPASGVVPERLEGALDLKDVRFCYAKGADDVLKGLSIAVRAGEMIGIAGPSGSGKSTLAKILAGSVPATGGSVRVDGVELSGLDPKWYRQKIGFVMQDVFLFDDTVAFNVSLSMEPDMQRVKRACRVAGVDRFVSGLPSGYLSNVGENGRLLSGGQRQRINIARAVYKDPAVLVMDEASSALDFATEAEIHEALAAMGCTRIVVAHRLSTLRQCGRILLLREGLLEDEGTFEDLADRNALFREMCLNAGVPIGGVA